MEGLIKKFQQRFRKVREEMDRWDVLQSRFISEFMNASSIIERLQVLQDSKNFGSLNSCNGVKDAVLMKQVESLQKIFLLMQKTLEEFHSITLTLGKIYRDGKQMVKGGTNQLTIKQLQVRVGVKPTLQDCLDGLSTLHEMHQSEYNLKVSLFSALSALALKPNNIDLRAVHQLLADQPNIPIEEGFFTPTAERADSVLLAIIGMPLPLVQALDYIVTKKLKRA